jgi:hypothetical protein
MVGVLLEKRCGGEVESGSSSVDLPRLLAGAANGLDVPAVGGVPVFHLLNVALSGFGDERRAHAAKTGAVSAPVWHPYQRVGSGG